MNPRVLVIGLSIVTLIYPYPIEAQQAAKVHRIGYLAAGAAAADAGRVDALRQGLHQLGYVEGKNISIESRFAEGRLDQLTDLAAQLVRLNVEVIVVAGGSGVRAAKKATDTIPIVMSNVSDPIELKFVASLARPGGNITGLMTQSAELGGRRLELLKAMVPKLSRVAVLSDRESQSFGVQIKDIRAAARRLAVELQTASLQGADDLENRFSAMKKERIDAIIGLQAPILGFLRRQIAELAVRDRLPSIFPDQAFPEAGALMSFGPDYNDLFRRAATYVDRILKGAKPGDLPVEGPRKFDLVINFKTAKQIGLTIPASVLKLADRIIK
jgi:putative ABC transport system substrate-binding protein